MKYLFRLRELHESQVEGSTLYLAAGSSTEPPPLRAVVLEVAEVSQFVGGKPEWKEVPIERFVP